MNKDVLVIINQNCNPFTLQELYLDGCEEITDDSLDCLLMKEDEKQYIKQHEQKTDRLMLDHRLTITNNKNETKEEQVASDAN